MEKKYKKGCTTGVFDLFHTGHLNILRQAKKLCDYLVVCVFTDECVKGYKGADPVIGVDMRAEILRAVKYVDEVIVMDNRNKFELWDKVKFDVLFIGDDWKGTERWNRFEREMKTVGADVIYIPYTKGISTTEIKNKIKSS